MQKSLDFGTESSVPNINKYKGEINNAITKRSCLLPVLNI